MAAGALAAAGSVIGNTIGDNPRLGGRHGDGQPRASACSERGRLWFGRFPERLGTFLPSEPSAVRVRARPTSFGWEIRTSEPRMEI